MLTAILLTGILTAPSSCDQPAMVLDQVSPDFPEAYRRPGHPMLETVSVAVYLDTRAKITRTKILQSSGIIDFDQAALWAAQKSTYRPRIVNCKLVPGRYIFKITFDGGP